MLLEGKNCIIYGGAGWYRIRRGLDLRARGRAAVSRRSHARDPGCARRRLGAADAAEVAVFDVRDEAAVEAHVRDVAARAGSLDVSFNLVTRDDVQGIPLVDMSSVEDFNSRGRATACATQLQHGASRRARVMAAQGGGVILHRHERFLEGGAIAGNGRDRSRRRRDRDVPALPGRSKLGSQGVRVLAIHTAGVQETLTSRKLQDVNSDAPDPEDVIRMISGMTLLQRAPRLAEVAETAAFLASDRASGNHGFDRQRHLRVGDGPVTASERLVAAARGGDETAFAKLSEPYRRELHVHCYRMLGSFEAAEDVVQETYLRAWRHLDRFEGGPLFRAWLYKIATNACLDEIRRDSRRVPALESFRDVPWLQPYPDRLLDEMAPREEEPETVVVERETIELTFVAVIQALPPRQRAVLIMRDVLDWTARGDRRAARHDGRRRQQRAPARPGDDSRAAAAGRAKRSAADLSEHERRLLEGFIDAHERGDAGAAIAMVREDIRITMPPNPLLFEGRAAMGTLLERAFGPESPGDWLLVPTRANRMPAAASYLRAHGRRRVPRLQARRDQGRGRARGRGHDVRPRALPAVRAAAHVARPVSCTPLWESCHAVAPRALLRAGARATGGEMGAGASRGRAVLRRSDVRGARRSDQVVRGRAGAARPPVRAGSWACRRSRRTSPTCRGGSPSATCRSTGSKT